MNSVLSRRLGGAVEPCVEPKSRAVGVQTGAAANTRSPAKKELCVGVEIQVPRDEPQNSWILKAFV